MLVIYLALNLHAFHTLDYVTLANVSKLREGSRNVSKLCIDFDNLWTCIVLLSYSCLFSLSITYIRINVCKPALNCHDTPTLIQTDYTSYFLFWWFLQSGHYLSCRPNGVRFRFDGILCSFINSCWCIPGILYNVLLSNWHVYCAYCCYKQHKSAAAGFLISNICPVTPYLGACNYEPISFL